MSTADKLVQMGTAVSAVAVAVDAVRSAIGAKGVSVAGASLADLPSKIAMIPQGGSVSSVADDPLGWGQGVLDAQDVVYGYQVFVLMNDGMDSITLPYATSYESGKNYRYVFSDGFTTEGANGSFTHVWDKDKDLDFSQGVKCRWMMIDTDDNTLRSARWMNNATDQRCTVVGVIFGGVSPADDNVLRDLYALRYVRFTSGAKFAKSAPYGGYFYYCQPQVIDGMDWGANTATYAVGAVACQCRNWQNIQANFTMVAAGRCSLDRQSVLCIINALVDTGGTTKTLTIGEQNVAKVTADELAVATGKGWTVA